MNPYRLWPFPRSLDSSVAIQHPGRQVLLYFPPYFAEEEADAQRGEVVCSGSHSGWLQSQLGCLQSGWSLSPLGAEAWVWALGLFGLTGWQDQGGWVGWFFAFFSSFFIAAALNSELLLPEATGGRRTGPNPAYAALLDMTCMVFVLKCARVAYV